ncbi:PCRF domain-containing protein, partial [Acinetobacter baumannii]
IEAELSTGVEGDRYVALSREFSELDPVVAAVTAYRAAEAELADLDQLIADPATDADMAALAREERPAVETRFAALEADLRIA